MCPACMTTAVLVAAGAGSGGGVAALGWKKLRGRFRRKRVSTRPF